MRSNLLVALLAAAIETKLVEAYTWPDPRIDHIESLLYEASILRILVDPCDTARPRGAGTTTAAEWLRTAYHDMATADVAAGTGGMDASIAWELLREENVGSALGNSLGDFHTHMGPRLSMADLIAIGAQLAVHSCSDRKIRIPYRAGRVDARGPGPAGVPMPHEGITEHTKSFERQGFNVSDMVAMVACGHAIGGVHGKDFPHVVPNPSPAPVDNVENVQPFDDSQSAFDNHIATGFLSNSTQNALAFGPNETTRSDFRIFTHPEDGGDMIGQMAASEDFFFATCQRVFERMINTVPKDVQLTEIISPIRVKPKIDAMFTHENNATMTIMGFIRILEDGSTSRRRSVTVHGTPRNPDSCVTKPACNITQENLPVAGSGVGDFTFYTLRLNVPLEAGISSFTVHISENGKSTIEDNGGIGFPINDVVFPITGDNPSFGSKATTTCRVTERVPPPPGELPSTDNVTVKVREDLVDPTTLELLAHAQVSEDVPLHRFEELRGSTPIKWRSNFAGTGYAIHNASVSALWNFNFGNRGTREFGISAKTRRGAVVENKFWEWEGLPNCELKLPG